MIKIVLLVTALLLPSLSAAGEVRNVNFAAFQAEDKDFEFEPVVSGTFSDFISGMEGSKILAMVHTADAVSGDVITMQTSVLRDEEGSLGDFGVDCQLSFKVDGEGDEAGYLLGGVCRIIQVGGGKNIRTSVIIPHANIPDTSQGFEGWIMLDEDEDSGIAFYANVSVEKH